jgi:hypothetical protein
MSYVVTESNSNVTISASQNSSLTVSLPTAELVSQERSAPFNGPRSAEDYNESIRERMIDLATLADLYNNYVRPILQTLSATALLPEESPIGLEGRVVFTDTSDQDPLFYDGTSGVPLTVADTVRLLDAKIAAFSVNLDSISATLGALQTRLSASGQVDVSKALQNLSEYFTQLDTSQRAQGLQITSLMAESPAATAAARVQTPMIGPSSVVAVQVIWGTAFPDNSYVATCNVQDDTGLLQVLNYSYLPNGTGIEVRVSNNDPVSSAQGYVSASAQEPH